MGVQRVRRRALAAIWATGWS